MENSLEIALHTVPEHKADMTGDDLSPFKAKAFFLFTEVVAYNLMECRQLLFEERCSALSSAPGPLPDLHCTWVPSAWFLTGARWVCAASQWCSYVPTNQSPLLNKS